MLFLLSTKFTSVLLTKPKSSRPANSEKYLVCKNFNGNSTDIEHLVQSVCSNGKIVPNISVPAEFVDSMAYIRSNFVNAQLINIEKVLVAIRHGGVLDLKNHRCLFESWGKIQT